jgi:hypothetical protein
VTYVRGYDIAEQELVEARRRFQELLSRDRGAPPAGGAAGPRAALGCAAAVRWAQVHSPRAGAKAGAACARLPLLSGARPG